ncbi:nitroreductase [Gordonia desulfuricans]|uniref:Nitroreductase n=1 Tax=Gordonia desulfuricans TaxID=89051 RepID=A0A7K3LMU6_9ACTN|nr:MULTISPECIES: nitroreductase family protein [Gordonia]EMP10573.1 nitroreductase [Gordonia sp. NB41Y]NDK89570.1 nitroreductase [Gordonia desulfuricans]WLP92600.1 nitroreductase family protein [Gordonia sp. NB41Y]
MHELIEKRWSARGYDPHGEVTVAAVTDILEAGRWAPTWGRLQPVRFVVGLRGDDTFERLVAVLNRGNKSWAPAAGALILLCTTDDADDVKPHDYGGVDLGFAAAQMSLEAVAQGLIPHPMAGFDAVAAREVFDIPDDKRPMLILAIGVLADDPATLADEVRERDEMPRQRLPLHQIAFTGEWGRPFTDAG